MPNWCANRLYFNPKMPYTKEQAIAAMDSTGFVELLAHGIHSARALFLLVFSGVIRVRGECYGREPLNWMNEYGGARIDFNKPVDDEASDLMGLLNGEFDSDKLARLVAFATSRRYFDTIDTLVEVIEASACWNHSMLLFKMVSFDYEHDWPKSNTSINDRYFNWLNYYYRIDEEKAKEPIDKNGYDGYHSMMTIMPPEVLPEINGFNGHMNKRDKNAFRSSSDTSRTSYVQKYGTKWPSFPFKVDVQDGQVFLDFETAWSPPNEHYFDLLSERIPQLEEIYYAEHGVGFCGSGLVLHPGTVFWRSSDLNIVWEEHDDFTVSVNSVEPAWIKDKVGSYGG